MHRHLPHRARTPGFGWSPVTPWEVPSVTHGRGSPLLLQCLIPGAGAGRTTLAQRGDPAQVRGHWLQNTPVLGLSPNQRWAAAAPCRAQPGSRRFTLALM